MDLSEVNEDLDLLKNQQIDALDNMLAWVSYLII